MSTLRSSFSEIESVRERAIIESVVADERWVLSLGYKGRQLLIPHTVLSPRARIKKPATRLQKEDRSKEVMEKIQRCAKPRLEAPDHDHLSHWTTHYPLRRPSPRNNVTEGLLSGLTTLGPRHTQVERASPCGWSQVMHVVMAQIDNHCRKTTHRLVTLRR